MIQQNPMARRRGSRFSNVFRLNGYNVANRDKLIDYLRGLADRPEPDLNAPVGDRTRRVLYVEPFTFPLAAGSVIEQSALQTSWTALGTIAPIPTYVTDTLGGNTSFPIDDWAAPRVSRKILGARELQTSRFTGVTRRIQTGDSASIPFGRNSLTDTVDEVYSTIAAALRANNANARVTLIPGS